MNMYLDLTTRQTRRRAVRIGQLAMGPPSRHGDADERDGDPRYQNPDILPYFILCVENDLAVSTVP